MKTVYEGEVCGTTVRIKDRDFEDLLDRFNPGHIDQLEVRKLRILRKQCKLCNKYIINNTEYSVTCMGECPFTCIKTVNPGCVRAVIEVIGRYAWQEALDIERKQIVLNEGTQYKTARRYFQEITDKLLTFKMVENE